MSRIIASALEDFPHQRYLKMTPKQDLSASVAHASCILAEHLGATAVVATTNVMGVNHQDYDPHSDHIVSNASCTTNCLAPAVKPIHERFKIVKGVMTTIHSYTNDQRILDQPHKDPRRARSAGVNIIPTTTGAARALALVIPELEGRFDGYSLRVPTPTVSVVDFTAILEQETDTDTLRATLKEAANGQLRGVMQYSEEQLVSTDFKGSPYSCIVDADFTQVLAGNMAKVVCWYDNEWGYSCRVADLADYIHRQAA
jgi:glyceraldehyde 3-phosphate dehydrogenase